jgi:hypothetical protein
VGMVGDNYHGSIMNEVGSVNLRRPKLVSSPDEREERQNGWGCDQKTRKDLQTVDPKVYELEV